MKRDDSQVVIDASDLVLVISSYSFLQQSLNKPDLYCSRNFLNVNIAKTKAIKIRRRGRLAKHEKVFLSSKTTMNTNALCYLGVIFSIFRFSYHRDTT